MSTLPEQICAAAAAADFRGAARLFEQYAQILLDRMRAGTVDEADIREAEDLVERTRRTALSLRSHLEAQIRQLRQEAYTRRAYATPRE